MFWLLENWKLSRNPKQEAVNALWDMYIPPAERPYVDCSVWWHFIFGVGVTCLFLLQGFSSTSNRRISKDKVPRFSFILTGRLELTSHKTNYYGTKIYYTFVEMLSTYEIAYHILHRNKAIDKQSR